MSPTNIFSLQLVLGYVAWLLCYRVYIWPRLSSLDRVKAQCAIATLHSFRFFGLAFVVPGVVGSHLPGDFAPFAAFYLLVRPAGRDSHMGRAHPY